MSSPLLKAVVEESEEPLVTGAAPNPPSRGPLTIVFGEPVHELAHSQTLHSKADSHLDTLD
jgi:hypothetical protein